VCPSVVFQVRHTSQQYSNTSKVPASTEQCFGQVSQVTHSLTAGEAARLFVLMNISSNFTMINYSKKFSTISHCSLQHFKTLMHGLCRFLAVSDHRIIPRLGYVYEGT